MFQISEPPEEKKRGSKLPLQSVQWLGLPDSNAGGAFNLRWGLRSHMQDGTVKRKED